jgi:hypothetical protein
VANLFFVVGANFIAFATKRALSGAIGFFNAKETVVALFSFHASVLGKVRGIFINIYNMLSDFA